MALLRYWYWLIVLLFLGLMATVALALPRGSLSLWHWLIVLAMVGIMAGIVHSLSMTNLRQKLVAMAEQSVYRSTRTSVELPKAKLPELPHLIVLWGVLLVAGLNFVPPLDISVAHHFLETEGRIPAPGMHVPAWPMTYIYASVWLRNLLIFFAIYMHIRPNHSRRLKYTILLAAIPLWQLLLIPSTVLHSPTHYGKIAHVSSFSERASLGVEALWPVAAAALLCLVGGPARIRGSGTKKWPPSWLARLAFCFCRMPIFGPSIGLLYLVGGWDLILTILTLRYLAFERFRRHPIVYLRSFRYGGASDVFGHSIVPALSPFGVIRALVHRSQTAGALVARTSIWRFGSFATVSDDLWQSWVQHALQSASLVIVDHSVKTESVEWEITAALKFVPEDKILLIAQEKSARFYATTISYHDSTDELKHLSTEIARWAKLHSPTWSSSLNIAAIATWVVLYLLLGIGMVGLFIL